MSKDQIKEQLYFESEDSEHCYPLSHHIENAKADDLKEIELFEAIPCTDGEMTWCTELEDVVESKTCNLECPYHESSEDSDTCKLKGQLMDWGDIKKFDVITGEQI